jgi:hypothetical protein
MELVMFIMAVEPISMAYFINLSHQSLCLCVYPPLSLLGNGSVNMLPQQRRILGGVVFVSYQMKVGD